MRNITLTDLKTDIRNRTDMNDTDIITEVELTSYINSSITELYDLLVSKYGDDYYLSSSSITMASGAYQVTLPNNFLKIKGVDLVEGNKTTALNTFNFKNRNRKGLLQWRVMGNNLIFTDDEKAGSKSLVVWFVPSCVKLTMGADTFDGINGWEEYVIVDCMIKCYQKEEQDVSITFAQKQALISRIELAAANRNAAEPERINCVRNRRTELTSWDENDEF